MSQRRYTVVQRVEFEELLAVLWFMDHDVQRSMDELESVLRTIPDQAGYPFYHQDEQFWHLQHRAIEILYRIVDEDRQVQLISIRLLRS
jgi:hypothetical protein